MTDLPLDPGPDIRDGRLFVDIRHPDTDGVGKVAEDALDPYLARGWVRYEPLTPPEVAEVAAEVSLKMGREELDTAARAAGVPDPESLPNKQAVLDAIAEADPTEPPSPDVDPSPEED